jgi:glutathione synthase/RimK-type ligase-like ATP-grasp enzyme
MDSILLVGRRIDPHIVMISKELSKLGEDYVIIDEFHTNDFFTVKFDGGSLKGEININNKSYHVDKIKSVWNSSPINIIVDKNIVKNSHEFIAAEWSEGISSLLNAIRARWVNHPETLSDTSHRLKQLQLAQSIGLRTPNTMITSNPNELAEFFNEYHQNIVAKTLHSSKVLQPNRIIFTRKITRDDFKYAKRLVYAPCMFQEYIDKKTEYRVTIIGNTIHAVEIDSQRSKRTLHDWRGYRRDDEISYAKTSLPKNIETKLLRLMETMNLKFGAIDLIKTHNDDLVFLEVNPVGRWLWIQQITGINIAKDIALFLGAN